MPGLDNTMPQSDASADHDSEMDNMPSGNAPATGDGGADREGAMAKADLFKLANYSHKLYQQLDDDDQLEAWVQAKITKAADYIASVYHYLAYEMKFTEYAHHLDNSDTLSEGQKQVLKSRLTEAKMKMKEIKKAQAEKMKKDDKIDESMVDVCGHCGGAGHVEKKIPEEVKNKVEKYNRLVKATKAAHKRLDANHNGIPDDEESELEEEFGGAEPKEMKTGDTKKTRTGVMTKTDTGVKHKNTSYADDGEAEQKSGKGIKTHAKAKDAETKKAEKSNDIKLPKHSGNTWGMKNGEKFGKKMEESTCNECDMPMAECSCTSMKEGAKPSAGLSKAKKSATVKDAKAGKDIGKPGKGFDKLAKKAGGGEKGEKIAAAAMWKNIKETTAYIAEKAKAEKKADKDYDGDGKIESGKDEHAGSVDKAIKAAKKETVKESTDFTRMQEQLARLNRSEKPALVENREVDQIRALTKRLLG